MTTNVRGPANDDVACWTHEFGDLARRQERVADVLNSSCFLLPFAVVPLKMVH